MGHQTQEVNNKLVLVVEDELALAQAIELYLKNDNYRTERALDGERALELFSAAQPDLMILDLGLPKLGGLDVLRKVRASSNVPIIILTARAEEIDEILGLGLGADDYLIKPVSARKLMAHVGALMRRTNATHVETQVITIGALRVDAYRMSAQANGNELPLTPTEFRLLHHLAQTPDRAISRQELFEVAMPESDAFERAVDIHITNLRKKLKDAGLSDPIETVRGVGYRISA